MGFYRQCFIGLFALLLTAHCERDPGLDNHWRLWVKTHKKLYKNEGEELVRRLIWEDTLKFIMLHNLEYSMGLHTYEVGMNHLGDMTAEEMTDKQMNFRPSEIANTTGLPVEISKSTPPESIDWRNKNCVTSVKDQGSCMSSWAFSSIGAMECQNMRKRTGKLESLSVQNLLDCSQNYGNNGCKGGWAVSSFRYIIDNGIELESIYPYQGKDGKCSYTPVKKAPRCTSYRQLPYGNEATLKQVVGLMGPVSVAIEGSRKTFRMYKSGVYYDPNCGGSTVDHSVLVVGYGAEDGVEYWLVKNSWGTSFGDEGYIKMARNRHNNCGIASFGCFPVI
uniref:MGC68723 protein n=1 Tax=Xenopus laevis TaxID=8355 RepID=Q6PA77_XENLA|nr:MGC68723 protein [Xenopus laevis]